MAYTTTWLPHGIIWIYSGNLTGQELLQSNLEIFGDERFDNIHFQIADLTNVESFDLTKKHIQKLAYLDMAAARSNPKVRVAVVTSAGEGFDMTELYSQQSAGKTPWKTKIFPSFEEAQAWVRTRD